MKFLKKLSLLFIAILALFLSHGFARAQHNYIGEDEIVIEDISYKNIETEFQKILPSDEAIPYYPYDTEYFPQDQFPSLDGQTVYSTVICEDASQSKCFSIGTAKCIAIGEPVYGTSYNGVSLWQKVIYDGKIYYVPYDNLYHKNEEKKQIHGIQLIQSVCEYNTIDYEPQHKMPGLKETISMHYNPITGEFVSEYNSYSVSPVAEKRAEGAKQIMLGVLDLAVGVVEITGGIVIAGGGTAGSGGLAAIPAIIGGAALIGLGANNVVSGLTGIWSGIKNIFSRPNDTKIHYDQFNPISEGIDSITEKGAIENTALHFAHTGADIIATIGAGKALATAGKIMITGSATTKVTKYAKIESIFKNPKQLLGKTPDKIDDIFRGKKNWKIETLGKGSQKGKGRIYREVNNNGDLTGRMIQWHPGGGHHGAEAYWKVSGGPDGLIRIGAGIK